MKKIISILLFTLSAFGMIILMGFIINKNMNSQLADIKINMYRNSDKGFLTNEDVLDIIMNMDSTEKIIIADVNTSKVENIITSNPYVDKVDCYVTIDGEMLINIKEKQPIVRIYNKENSSCYIDDKGNIFGVSNKFAPRVLIANGYITNKIENGSNINDSIYNNSHFKDIFILTKLINSSNLLSAQISQIYVNSKGKYDLIPTIGNQLIKFGSLENAEKKIQKLDAYYHKYLKTSIWNNYKTINLIYKNQIVCTKK